uniref:Cytochrome P450 n=1 Tax=Acrobeloides nanus TaxID=290746 RepID=A0A914DS23_9BILA
MTLYILAKHPEIQTKLREEIFHVCGDKEELDYEDLRGCHYMYQIICETLRMYPPAVRTNREADSELVINGIHIPKGCQIAVPIYLIHYDDKYYPNPQKFDPDRWLPEEKAKRDPLTWLPFGYGPRNCLGLRFAELQIMMGLAHIIRKFEFIAAETSPDLPVDISSKGTLKTTTELFVKARLHN